VHLPGQAEGSSLSEAGWPYWHSVARIGIQVADALGYAASQGVLHRDIKPSNLLLDTRGTVWVTDFGLAKADTDRDDVTHTGDIVGTLRYMAPERFEGKADVRSDLYALGLTLYELLTLRPAFDGSDRNRLITRVLHEQPPRPRKLDPAIPRDLETIVLKATARDPAQRYQTPGELADDLQRFLEDRPIRARRLGALARGWRWCRRNPAVAALTGAVLLLLVAVAVVASVGYVQTTLALGREEAQHRAAVDAAGRASEARAKAVTAAGEARAEAARSRRLLYDADMQLCSQLWESEHGTAGAIADLLAAHVPGAGEEDLRDFTWHYQRGLLRRARTLEGHKEDPDAAFAPGGAVLTFDQAHVLRYWPKARPPAARPTDLARLGSVCCWAFAPEGTGLALGMADGRLVLYDPATTRARTLHKGAADLADVEFSGDGRKLFSIHADARARLWDLATGKELATVRLRNASFSRAAVSPDGRTLVLANHPRNATVSVYRVGETDPRLLNTGHTVQSAAFSPDGKVLASGDVWVILWDGATLKERARFAPQGGRVNFLAFSRDGTRLASHLHRRVLRQRRRRPLGLRSGPDLPRPDDRDDRRQRPRRFPGFVPGCRARVADHGHGHRRQRQHVRVLPGGGSPRCHDDYLERVPQPFGLRPGGFLHGRRNGRRPVVGHARRQRGLRGYHHGHGPGDRHAKRRQRQRDGLGIERRHPYDHGHLRRRQHLPGQ
jgi:hypothetical protein